jgi:urease accessory protein
MGTAMDNTSTTITDADLLQLVWLASPALPVGGFSYSEGLEAAVEAGHVRDEQSAGDWLVAQLHASLARADLAVVAAAVAAARAGATERLDDLDHWVRQTRETSELRQQAEQMGRSLCEWAKSVGRGDVRNPDVGRGSVTYPVAFALAAANSGASLRHITLTFAFAWSENMMQAAIKAVPLGQSAGQRILARLATEIPHAVDHALTLDDADRQSFTPMLAILSAQHETQYSRLFRS